MSKLESLISKIHVYHLVALKIDKMSKDNVDWTVKLAATMTASSPLVFTFFVAIVVLVPIVGVEQIKVPFAAAVLVTVFGVSSITDRVYDRNFARIEQQAAEARADLERGPLWARMRLLEIYAGQIVISVIVAFLLRLAIN